MANALYPSGRRRMISGGIDLDTDTLTIVGMTNAYSYSPTHEFASDLDGEIGTPFNLTGRVVLDDGVFDADDVTYMGVAIGVILERLAIYKNTGSPASSPLIYYCDTTSGGSPLSRVGDGGGIPIIWDDGPTRIFRV